MRDQHLDAGVVVHADPVADVALDVSIELDQWEAAGSRSDGRGTADHVARVDDQAIYLALHERQDPACLDARILLRVTQDELTIRLLKLALHRLHDRGKERVGVVPSLVAPAHPIAKAWRSQPPMLLGYNRVLAKPEAEVVATVNRDVLIATAEYGAGRSLVWTSDIGPHWCPVEFSHWTGFDELMASMVKWLQKTP